MEVDKLNALSVLLRRCPEDTEIDCIFKYAITYFLDLRTYPVGSQVLRKIIEDLRGNN